MNNWLPIALAASVLLSSCSTVRSSSLILPTVPAIPSTAAISTDPATTTVLPQSLRRVAHSASLTIVVDDPAMALSRLQGAVLEAGGFVSATTYRAPVVRIDHTDDEYWAGLYRGARRLKGRK